MGFRVRTGQGIERVFTKSRKFAVQAALIFFAGLIGSISFWEAENREANDRVTQIAEDESRFLSNVLAFHFGYQSRALERAVQRWEAARYLDEQVWRSDARRLMEDYFGLEALGWRDASGNWKWEEFEDDVARQAYAAMVGDSRILDFLSDATTQTQLAFSPIIAVDGAPHFFFTVPAQSDDEKAILFGLYELNEFLDRVVNPRSFENYRLTIDANGFVYTFGSPADSLNPHIVSGETVLGVSNITWRFRVEPTFAISNELRTHLPVISLIFGVLLSLLLALSYFLFRTAAARAKELGELANALKTSEERAKLLVALSDETRALTDPDEIIQRVMELLRAHMQADWCTYADIDSDGQHFTITAIACGPGVPTISGRFPSSSFGSQVLATLRQDQPWVVGDTYREWPAAADREAYEQLGIRATVVTPLLKGGRPVGAVGVHMATPRDWSSEELSLLREVSERLWESAERARIERDLRDNEERLRAALEGANAGVWTMDLESRETYWSPEFRPLYGYDDSPPRTFNAWLASVHPEDRERVQREMERRVNSEATEFRQEFRIVHPKLGARWILDLGRIHRDSTGKATSMSGINIDISRQKQQQEALRKSEESLRELNASLEERVASRTAELEQQRSRLRRLAAELSSAEMRERKRLAAVLHDHLQQLLVAAKMQLNSTEHTTDPVRLRFAIDKARGTLGEAVESARDLTRQLRPPVLYEDGLAAALNWLAGDFQKRHGLHVALSIEKMNEPMSEEVNALLYECVRELLFNAVKYAEVRDAHLMLRQSADAHVELVVTDHGKGFDAAELSNGSRDGGFGLFSIRERLAAVGGSLTITSAPGEGTSALLRAPAPASHDGASGLDGAAALKVARPALAQGIDRSDVRVVVVDDHVMVRQGIANIVDSAEGLKVVGHASNGLEALQVVEEQRPDVVLMDVNMPQMNGIEATREIRARWPEVHVIGLSVHEDEATAQTMRNAGAATFLPKAGDPEELLRAIISAFVKAV